MSIIAGLQILFKIGGPKWSLEQKSTTDLHGNDYHLVAANLKNLTELEYKLIYFSTKTYVVGTQKNRLNETVLLSTQNIC